MTVTKDLYQAVVNEMARKRSVKHWSKKDVQAILNAQETGQWEAVRTSRLYTKYSSEYCSLLEVLHTLTNVKEAV